MAHTTPDGPFLLCRAAVQGHTYAYAVYLPAGYEERESWPLILFLHGAGEKGTDGLLQTTVALPRIVLLHPELYPAVIVMPQCRKECWWSDQEMQSMALAILDRSVGRFKADVKRVSLTGISMGGYGTWDLGAKHPERWAALAPICGGLPLSSNQYRWRRAYSPYLDAAKRIGSTPVWAFHGADDEIIPAQESRLMVDALEGAGGDVRYTEYAGVGHNSWDRAYAEPEFAEWLLDQSRT